MSSHSPSGAPRKLRVCHIITGLPIGGAQTMLANLAAHREEVGIDVIVISLTDHGPMGERIRKLGVPVRALGMSRSLPNPLHIVRLASWLRKSKPDVVQTWMYHADLVGGLAARLVGIPCVWNVRHSDLPTTISKRATIWTARACARLSARLPKQIVCCSKASYRIHRALGYDGAKMLVIGNGVDLTTFRPDDAARNFLRRALNLGDDTPLVGLIARFDAQKDHRTFLRAAAELGATRPDVHFVLCGEYVDSHNRLLIDMAKEGDIGERVHLLGRRNDIPIVTAGLDVSTSSSSFGEGFSNVLIEAQACGVPCVATDIGDASDIVGNAGLVVPPRDPSKLAEAMNGVLSLSKPERRLRSIMIRRRAEKLFGLPDVVARYDKLYREITQRNQEAAGNR